jgi:hypothetical protein
MLIDGKPSTNPTLDAPQTLILTKEPRADVGRYDALRVASDAEETRHAS